MCRVFGGPDTYFIQPWTRVKVAVHSVAVSAPQQDASELQRGMLVAAK